MSLLPAIFFVFFSAAEIFCQDAGSPADKKIIELINAFDNEDIFLSGDAVNEIVGYGETSVPYLIRLCESGNENQKLCSVIALGKIAPAGRQAIPLLNELLKDESSDIRWCSAIALGKYKNDAVTAVPGLQNLLYDENPDVRWAAYVSLRLIDKNSLNITPDYSALINKIESLVPALMNELNVPGVSISIIKDKKISASKYFGVADADEENDVNSVTMFEACSMSKPVFTYIVLQIAEKGLIKLDEPLYNYLPEEFVTENGEYTKQITARMILTHTSGMPNWRKAGEERNAPLPLYFKPGSKFLYSGEGIYYLQRVVEHITGERLESLSKRLMFDKLEMNSSSFVWTNGFDKQIATGHDADGDCNKRSRYLRSNAAYTLYTTSDDYAKFIVEVIDPKIISPGSRDEMISHQFRSDIREVIERPGRNFGLQSFRGLGWAVDSTITGNIVYHSGSNQTGFKCYSQFDPLNGSGIVILTNAENGSELWRRLITQIGDY